ncbi:MAG: HAD family hydrolase [Pseudomonadota bacterium]
MLKGAVVLDILAFDADDTLWDHEQYYRLTEDRFTALLADYAEPRHLTDRLLEAERRNILHYGFGVKGFTLSMIETAIEITNARVPAQIIGQILEAGREMHAHPIDLRPGAREALEALRPTHSHLRLITKGDLFDQERKLAQSGLGPFFDAVDVVADKTPQTYRRCFGEVAERALMVGNSLKSDVLPALDVGAWGVHVPHELEWVLDRAEAPTDAPRFRTIPDLHALPALVEQIEA